MEENGLNWWQTQAESQDINPIEKVWNDLKRCLREIKHGKQSPQLVANPSRISRHQSDREGMERAQEVPTIYQTWKTFTSFWWRYSRRISRYQPNQEGTERPQIFLLVILKSGKLEQRIHKSLRLHEAYTVYLQGTS